MTFDWHDEVNPRRGETPEQAFEKLSDMQKAAIIERNNEEVRDWFAFCPNCKKKIKGKLFEIKKWRCNCGR